jgi:hypothetical protein
MFYNRPSGAPRSPPPGLAAPRGTMDGTVKAEGGVPTKFRHVMIGAVAVSVLRAGGRDAA